ncbi:prxl2a [Scenedesmus sp. PABB004]|nr:prxl2a [Scenedesmus sp. PABB004]
MVEQLAASGMTPAKAKETLRVWAELGAQEPEALRRLLMQRSLAPLTALAVQSVLDFVACGGGFYIGNIAGKADFPGSFFVSLLGYFFGCYYALQAVFQVTALATLTGAARRYSTDASVLLEAVRQLAGPGSGLSVVDSATLVANTLKVIQTLETIGSQLKDIAPAGATSSLANLSAYLTLQRAEEVYGFQPEAFGLSEAQAADIAGVFSRFDANEDGRLEQSELRTLCSQLGTDISEVEAKEAVRLLDSGATGYISFSDFVEWYLGRRPSRQAKEDAAVAAGPGPWLLALARRHARMASPDSIGGATLAREGAGGGAFAARELWAEKPVFIYAIRRPGCVLCRDEAQKLWDARAELEAAGLRVVCIVHEWIDREIAAFAPAFWGGEVFFDKDKAFYKLFGQGSLRTGSALAMLNPFHPAWRRILDARKRVAESNVVGEASVLGGLLVVKRGGAVAWMHPEVSFGDFPPTADVVAAAKAAVGAA